MSDSSDVDAALATKLRTDPTLAGLLPDGVFIDEAAPGLTKFLIISLVDSHDEPIFGKRAWEDNLYLVKAVVLNDDSNRAKLAAKRIDELLDPQPPEPRADLDIPGYGVVNIRRVERVRTLEVDEADNQIRWQHRGGRYQVMVAPSST